NLINTAMPALCHLNLNVRGNRLSATGPIHFPVLRQLHSFHFGSNHPFNEVAESFSRYGQPNAELVDLGLVRTGTSEPTAHVDQFIRETEARVATLFTRLFIRTFPFPLLGSLTARFTSISALQIS